MKNIKNEIYSFLPPRLISVLDIAIKDEMWTNIEEIRIFKKGYIIVSVDNNSFCLNNLCHLCTDDKNPYITDSKLTDEIINILTNFSPYAYEYHLAKGYITAKGGHRIGLCGTGCIGAGNKYALSDISALNIRICKEIDNFGMEIACKISCNNRFLNTVIISPPKCGKTTLLRAIAKNLSVINRFPNVCIIDERKELCAIDRGVTSFDVGKNTFVLDSINKITGIKMAVQSLSPDIIICDEISSSEDANALLLAVLSGVSVVFSCHGRTYNDFLNKYSSCDLSNRIEFYVELSNSSGPGTIEKMVRCSI